jgi:hypothetical protein
MSKRTVRANARTLPEATNRRAVLRAMLVAGTIGAIPVEVGAATAAEPVSGPAGLDAGLFALIDEASEAGARVEAALGALEEAQERTEKVPWPQALIVTEDDTRLWKLKAGDPFDLDHLNLMRRRQEHRQNSEYLRSFVAIAGDAPYVATLNDKNRALLEMLAAIEVREDQLIAALDHRNEARRVAEDRSGETAANERLEQLMDEKYEVCNRVSITRARTLSGVLAKLALIASDFDDESASELPGEMGTSPQILFSIAADFKELKSGRALSGENVESRLSMLKSKFVGATAVERDEIIRDILACKSLCRQLTVT